MMLVISFSIEILWEIVEMLIGDNYESYRKFFHPNCNKHFGSMLDVLPVWILDCFVYGFHANELLI